MDLNRDKDRDQNEQSRPTIQPPGQQPDQQQLPNAPPQALNRPAASRSSQWIPPSTGNPDIDPVGITQAQRIDLRETNPLTPQGMLYDPSQLLDGRRQPNPIVGLPPGARFDPFGPPDPDQVRPGHGPNPSFQFGVPDPDHLPPPGVPQLNRTMKAPPMGPGRGAGKGAGCYPPYDGFM